MAKKIVFGSGSLFAVPSAANSTPVQFGVLQGVSLDFAFSVKELYGQNNFPVTVARGTGKITAKASVAQFQPRAINDLFFGNSSLPTGKVVTQLDESAAIPTTPFTVTVANGATMYGDLGVYEAATGSLFTRVASAPATGQYSVNEATGVYTFAAADTGKTVKISYQYTVSASGSKIIIQQALIGQANTFKSVLSTSYNGQQLDLQLNACVATKLSFATKQEDFAAPDFEFSIFADAAGVIGQWNFPDQN